jgi:hypothetical protein
MPSTSKKQHNFMAAVANNPKFAKKVGVPKSVGEEFTKADKGRKFERGGEMAESKKMVKKEVAFMKSKGAPKSMVKHEEAEMKGMKKGGNVKKMFVGGMSNGRGFAGVAPRSKVASAASQMPSKISALKGSNSSGFAGGPRVGMKKGGCTDMAKGGGIESKGKTKGKMVVMKRGGKC